jgi:murein DD-endopeptidase MepM/ murein hydrolase activator NlpD
VNSVNFAADLPAWNMPKAKYRYNPKTLTYEKAKPKTGDYLKSGLKYLGLIALTAFLAIYTFNRYVDSPKEVELQRELKFLKSQLAFMQSELDTLSLVATDLRKQDDEIYRSIFGTTKYPEHLRKPGIGGTDRYNSLKGYNSSDEIIETRKKISSLQRQMVAQSRSFEEVYELARNKKEMLQSIPAIQPVSNLDLTRIASGFGMRIHPIYKIPKMHTGMDFTAPTGTEIYATGDGKVISAEKKGSGYGYHVEIEHGFGYETLYGHMDKILVRKGEKVKRGQVIGLVGNTGSSVGSHLHYEVKKDGEKVNPAHYFFNDLSPQQYDEMLERASQANQSLD